MAAKGRNSGPAPGGSQEKRQTRPAFPTVAIGCSAGGVFALQALFEGMRDDLGAAFVVVLHLDPSRPSELVPILQRKTKMTVVAVESPRDLTPNCVYVVSPDRGLLISDTHIESHPFADEAERRAPIDRFFRSLAEQHGDGFAIVLTGAGSDGSGGIKSIKDHGGVVIVQEPKDAEHPSMPKNAIATGLADVIAPLAEIPDLLAELVESKSRIDDLEGEAAEGAIRRILAFVRGRTGHDFSQYKRPTIVRRLMRRMQLARIERLDDYAAALKDDVEEINALFADLLISVTAFFRDPKAFEALTERVIPKFFEDDRDGEPVRVWVTGCATGEEAYSIAILLLEEAARRQVRPEFQIFATDLDAGALASAREGRYPAAIEADVSEERLKRYFTREGDHYRVRKEVRDLVVFAQHSMVKDPPFSRLDLVTCRNLLIYLEREMQTQLCVTFRYALKSDGYLFLGSAETADSIRNLFRPVDREHRIYQAVPDSERLMPMLHHGSPASRIDARPRAPGPAARTFSEAGIHREALERLAPPSILVDDEHRILHLSESAGRYLAPSGGPLSMSITQLARPELRVDIHAGLNRALEKGEASVSLAAPVKFNGAAHRVYVQVTPAKREAEDRPRALVFFFEGGAIEPSESERRSGSESEFVGQLQEELAHARDHIRVSREEYEAANEELRAANEELQSINEEYRSTAEELETSKEELQSMNEELQTLNSELKLKLDAVNIAHSDLQNLVAATEVATLFLDSRFRINRFTPALTRLFSIAPGDEGRPITDLTHRLRYTELEADSREVLKTLGLVEREIESADGHWYLTRLRPYRTIDDRIDGVVITFIDVTDRRRAEEEARATSARLQFLMQELSHRMKNTLSVVQAMARLSFREDISRREAMESFSGRLVALSHAHQMLIESDWTGANLSDVIGRQIGAHLSDGKVSVAGPEVMLPPALASSFGLILHELTTNAMKYGALSAPKGTVAISWSLSDGDLEPVLDFEWRERGVDIKEQPTRSGFGSHLIDNGLPGAKVRRTFDAKGVICTITAPVPSAPSSR